MFKVAFWVVVLVLLIPTNNDPKDLSKETNLTGDTMTLAQGLYRDFSGICDRNAETCEAARQIRLMFEHKLKTGASMVISYLDRKETDTVTTGSVPSQ